MHGHVALQIRHKVVTVTAGSGRNLLTHKDVKVGLMSDDTFNVGDRPDRRQKEVFIATLDLRAELRMELE